jgi:VanZ family protein
VDQPPPATGFSPWTHFYRRALPAYWIFLFCATHFPRLRISGPLPNIDKILHGLCFGLLAFLLWRFIETFRRPASSKTFWTILVVLAGYGILDEWLQGFVGRGTDLADWIADVIGTVAVLLVLESRRRRAATQLPPVQPG